MEVKLIAGTRDEKMIELVKATVEKCQGESCDIPHEVGPCRYCRSSKYGCAMMDLCRQYGFDKVYDAVFYAYGGNEQILDEIGSFEWETMTQEQYGFYLEWLSNGKIMAS